MSGILDKKQRLVDFILTADGYRQVENGDLRFVYATLTDKDAIYDRRQNEYNVADLDAMSFNFEASSNFFDKLNSEIDLKQTANFELRTEIDGQYIDLRNNEYQNTLTKPASLIFDKISGSFAENLVNQQIILTDNFFNLNLETGENNPISLYVSKINKDKINLNSEINLENQSCSIQINSLTDYNTLCNSNSLNLSKTSMIEDDRFKNKLNYLFLPPANMNTEVITRNNKISNSYNLAEDKRDLHKIIFKNFKSNGDVAVELLRNFKDLQTNNVDDVILESIKILKYEDFNIAKLELSFENREYDTEFVLNLSELNSTGGFIFNKLLFINQGEIFDKDLQKNVQVYSAGKLLTSKTEIDLDKDFRNNLANGQYIIEDNYLFINLFTIVIE
jgi:hypothetical protein